MRFDYLLYPSAVEKIKSSGLDTRIQDLKKSEDGLCFIGGCTFEDDVVHAVSELKSKGFYEHVPQDFYPTYKEVMNGILANPKNHNWSVQRPEGLVKEHSELDDLLLFTGENASLILKPDEIWDYERFGFDSPTSFIASVGSYVQKESSGLSDRKGYTWITERKNGSQILTEITGDNHADLRVYQTDIAPYNTKDPFDNPILMRPKLKADSSDIFAYHSTEGILLTAVLKYIDQQDIEASYRLDNAKRLIDWGKSLGQSGGSCTEHFGGFDHDSRLFFSSYDLPIPQLDENDETTDFPHFWLGTAGESIYGTYIDAEGNLIFSHQTKKDIHNPKKTISAKFLPEDAEHLVKGLIYQCASGHGRTSANQVLSVLEYRYSSDFKHDI